MYLSSIPENKIYFFYQRNIFSGRRSEMNSLHPKPVVQLQFPKIMRKNVPISSRITFVLI